MVMDDDAWAAQVSAVAWEYGLPVRLSVTRPLAQTRVGRFAGPCTERHRTGTDVRKRWSGCWPIRSTLDWTVRPGGASVFSGRTARRPGRKRGWT